MGFDNWTKFLIHITRSYPNNNMYLGDTPYEKFLIEYTKNNITKSEEEIYELAPIAYSDMQETSKKIKKNLDESIAAVRAVAAKYEDTWHDESLLDSQK